MSNRSIIGIILEVLFFLIFESQMKADKCGMKQDALKAHDCQDVMDMGFTESNVYHVTPAGTFRGFDVYCDMATDNGGWIVFQRRVDGSEDFYRSWDEYEIGFGNLTSEHWLGNLALHIITAQGTYELRVDLAARSGDQAFAKYKIFNIADSTKNYQLIVEGFSGDANDSLSHHSGYQFSTKDRDNDKWEDGTKHCAQHFRNGWWFNKCHWSNLNGIYGGDGNISMGIIWHTWQGWWESLTRTEMKIRRVYTY